MSLYDKKLWLNMDIKRQSGVVAHHLIYSIVYTPSSAVIQTTSKHAMFECTDLDRFYYRRHASNAWSHKYFELSAFGYFME